MAKQMRIQIQNKLHERANKLLSYYAPYLGLDSENGPQDTSSRSFKRKLTCLFNEELDILPENLPVRKLSPRKPRTSAVHDREPGRTHAR